MHRLLLMVSAVLFVGCAKSEPPASQSTTPGGETTPTAAIALADLAGTWDGTVMAAGSDAVLTTMQLTATAEASGWTMTVTNATDPAQTATVTANSVVAEGDSVIVEMGPFASVLRAGQQVSTRSVFRLQDGNLVGAIVATYPANGETVMLRSVSTKKAG